MLHKIILAVLSLVLVAVPPSHAADFCVADLKLPSTPAGFQCKKAETVTVDDFVFSCLDESGNTSNIFGAAVTPVFVEQFHGLNGLGLSMARLDLDLGGVFPLHSHPSATELLYVEHGHITAGFISPSNNVFYKTLRKGDAMVFPPGQLHFHVNEGRRPSTAFATFCSDRPGVQILDEALFGNDLPPKLVSKTTLLGLDEVKRLKAIINAGGYST